MYLQLASIISNLCLCHDLMKTLHSPFNVGGQRLKNYTAVSLLSPLAILVAVLYKDKDRHYKQFDVDGLDNVAKFPVLPSEISDIYNFRLCNKEKKYEYWL